MRVVVEFEWRDVGSVYLEGEMLRFPAVEDVPGIYQFDLGDRLYVGESDRLRRRFQHYRTPGVGQPTNIRLNSIMRTLLAEGVAVAVAVITVARAEVDGAMAGLDLGAKAARLLVESAVITAERLAGRAVENL